MGRTSADSRGKRILAMSAFGERLRREREMRGITLDEISESTKISRRHLESLEREDFDSLPGGLFNKGFVRSYARFLGLDETRRLPPTPQPTTTHHLRPTTFHWQLNQGRSASPLPRAPR